MKNTEQEIIDMENFYATATLEEAFAYFKMKSDQCFTAMLGSVDRMKKVIRGMVRFFVKPKSTAQQLRDDLSVDKILQNYVQLSVDDQLQMNLLLRDALEILIKE